VSVAGFLRMWRWYLCTAALGEAALTALAILAWPAVSYLAADAAAFTTLIVTLALQGRRIARREQARRLSSS